MCLQFDLLFWPDCLQIFGPKSGEILKLTPLIRVNFRETAFSCEFMILDIEGHPRKYNERSFLFSWKAF